jgi:hypothetical protein
MNGHYAKSICKPICRRSLLLLIAGWFLLALFVGEIELLSILPGYAIPAIVLSLSAGLLAVFWIFRPFRRCLEELDFRALILPHFARFVGIYFLVLYSRGLLPAEFAIPAGWGDIIVAMGAVMLFIPAVSRNRISLVVWNVAGLVDILFVVKTAASIVIVDRGAMAVMTHLPLSFLPTMIVPLIIFTHVVMLARLRGARVDQKATVAEGSRLQAEAVLGGEASRPF